MSFEVSIGTAYLFTTFPAVGVIATITAGIVVAFVATAICYLSTQAVEVIYELIQ